MRRDRRRTAKLFNLGFRIAWPEAAAAVYCGHERPRIGGWTADAMEPMGNNEGAVPAPTRPGTPPQLRRI